MLRLVSLQVTEVFPSLGCSLGEGAEREGDLVLSGWEAELCDYWSA